MSKEELRKLAGFLTTWVFGPTVIALAAMAGVAVGAGLKPGPEWMGIALFALLVLVLVARWFARRYVLKERETLLGMQARIEELDQEKAQLIETREQMRHFAEHDDLTGLWNHRIMDVRLRQEIDRSRREGTPMSVILIDLDHFKLINDNHGHMSGDLVLKTVASIFKSSVRSYDWVGRYGGEEFLLVLPTSGFTGARSRAEQLRKAVEMLRIVDGKHTLQITASFGVASGFPTAWDALIKAADAALYRAKDNGRNCVVGVEI